MGQSSTRQKKTRLRRTKIPRTKTNREDNEKIVAETEMSDVQLYRHAARDPFEKAGSGSIER